MSWQRLFENPLLRSARREALGGRWWGREFYSYKGAQVELQLGRHRQLLTVHGSSDAATAGSWDVQDFLARTTKRLGIQMEWEWGKSLGEWWMAFPLASSEQRSKLARALRRFLTSKASSVRV